MTLQESMFDFLYRHGLDNAVLSVMQQLPAGGRAASQVLRFFCHTRRLQVAPEEIKIVLPYARQARSMLVFGLGRDTAMWIAFGPGDIVFLEDNPLWIASNARFSEQIVRVCYDTRRQDYLDLLDNVDKLQMELPGNIHNRRWDVVFVDAPNGYADHQPGRMQSIYAASRLVHPDGVVIVHDIDRPVEQVYAEKYLGPCIQSHQRLGVFRAPGS